MPERIKLEGERLAWFELAHHLRMPVEALKDEITYSEFYEWREFLRLHRDRDAKEHFYLAQIAAEIRRSFVKHPEQVKIKDFLLKFSSGGEDAPDRSSPGYKAHRIALSKGAWLSALKMNPTNAN